jgi:hypothetical protein
MAGWVKKRNIHASLQSWLRAQNTGFGMAVGSRTIFVDGVNGDDHFAGYDDPASAKATIGEGITAANAWDVIYIAPKAWTTMPYSYPGLNTAFAESNSIAYAKSGLAMVGIGHSDILGGPHGVVIRETASAITANLAVYAPMCTFENLAFERGGSETGGQLVFKGGTGETYEANAATVFNCYFFYANGTTGPGNWGGAIMADQMWGLTVDQCKFLGCRVGISFQSGGATAGDLEIGNCTFMSRNLTASEIDADIAVYTQGATCINIHDIHCAHLIPSLSGGALLRWIVITGDVRQGLLSNIYCAGEHNTAYTYGAGTGISSPANVGVSHVYDGKNAVMAHA